MDWSTYGRRSVVRVRRRRAGLSEWVCRDGRVERLGQARLREELREGMRSPLLEEASPAHLALAASA